MYSLTAGICAAILAFILAYSTIAHAGFATIFAALSGVIMWLIYRLVFTNLDQ